MSSFPRTAGADTLGRSGHGLEAHMTRPAGRIPLELRIPPLQERPRPLLGVADGEQQADTHITVRHASPDCISHQLYKGILAGRAKAVFNGRIIVDQDAQKTDARQSNRNLLLSNNAVVNSNPQLEIFADDVRCTHGSTVGQIDEEAVFYLRSRGIGRDSAVQLLTLAFAGEILERIPVVEVRERLERVVVGRLAAIAETKGNQ